MNRIVLSVVVVSLGVLGYFSYQRMFGGPAGINPAGGAMPVMVAPAESIAYSPTFTFTGRLKAVAEAEVRPQVGGMVEKIHFAEGQLVKQGDPLFTLDLRNYTAAASQAKAQLEQAKLAYERGVALAEQDAISKADLENRKAAWQSAAAANTAAQVNLDFAVVKAPISGRVGRADVTLGNVVSPQSAQVLTTVQQLDPMYADFELSEQDYLHLIQLAGGVTPNLSDVPVAVGLAADGADFPMPGKLAAIDNRLGGDTGSLRARAELGNTNGVLVPGLFARVRVTVPTSETVVAINDAAIGTDQTMRYVYKINAQGQPERTVVTLGDLTTEGLRVITKGLNAGDKIVVNGLMRIMPGMPVQPVDADMRTLQPLKPVGAPAQQGAAPAEAAPAAEPAKSE